MFTLDGCIRNVLEIQTEIMNFKSMHQNEFLNISMKNGIMTSAEVFEIQFYKEELNKSASRKQMVSNEHAFQG
eukprot:gene879-1704_t